MSGPPSNPSTGRTSGPPPHPSGAVMPSENARASQQFEMPPGAQEPRQLPLRAPPQSPQPRSESSMQPGSPNSPMIAPQPSNLYNPNTFAGAPMPSNSPNPHRPIDGPPVIHKDTMMSKAPRANTKGRIVSPAEETLRCIKNELGLPEETPDEELVVISKRLGTICVDFSNFLVHQNHTILNYAYKTGIASASLIQQLRPWAHINEINELIRNLADMAQMPDLGALYDQTVEYGHRVRIPVSALTGHKLAGKADNEKKHRPEECLRDGHKLPREGDGAEVYETFAAATKALFTNKISEPER